MNRDIIIPSVGESVTSGILSAWLKNDGDPVREGEPLLELETDKASVEVPAIAAGKLKILVQAGSEVEVDQKIGILEDAGTGSDSPAAPAAGKAEPVVTEQPRAATPPQGERPLSPAVRRVVAENKLDPDKLTGTGPQGRVLKEDAQKAATPTETPPQPAPAPPATPATPAVPGAPPTREPMSLIRRKTAERLVTARQHAAHVTTFNEIDMQKVIAIRSHYKEAFEKEHATKIGFMSFFVKACCEALKNYPVVNAMVDGETIVYNNTYDIGVAISTERGLVVPVIRGADDLTFAQIEQRIAALAVGAKEKRLSPDELTGGTFTITNGGVFGSLFSTPIPAYPQSAILGMHAIKKRATVVDDKVVVRPVMIVALTYDHRIIDGREAVQFLAMVKEFIEEPDRLLLEL